MPRVTVDYSNTIIYKIFCKNPDIKDMYVGHTTNFVQRKHAHKQAVTNTNSSCYHTKVYEEIRKNGGWDNWSMEIVNFFKCKNSYEARKKEQEYYVLLNATLNTVEPLSDNASKLVTPNQVINRSFFCKKCSIYFCSEKLLETHNKIKKHNMDISIGKQQKNPKNPLPFVCDLCNYSTSNRKDYKKHSETKKHKYNIYNNNTTSPSVEHSTHVEHSTIVEHNMSCVCVCGKSYSHRASLYNHKKKCIILLENNKPNTQDVKKSSSNDLEDMMCMGENTIVGDKINITTDMFMKLMNENQEMIKIIKEQQHQINAIIPKIGSNVTTTNNNMMTTNNTNFNLNFFLNEKCKDALNMSEFIESLKITLEDLQYSRSNGLVQGISNVMIRGLKELDIYKRPIHCTDVKRDTMYIKDKEKWEKDESHEKMRNTILKIANKERNAISAWVEQNPDWMDTETTQMEYLTLINKVCEPIENDIKNEKKIIKIIGKEIILNKDSEKLLKNAEYS